MKEQGRLGQWLKGRCEEEHLSLRQVATKVGVSHQTIASVRNGKKILPTTIKKLTEAFGYGRHQRLALEDHLLVLAGYRSERPEEEEPSEAFGRLIDKLEQLNEPRVKMVTRFVDFLTEILGED